MKHKITKQQQSCGCYLSSRHQVWHYTGTLLRDTKVGKDEELWEAVWQPALEGQYPEPKISYKPIATSADGPAQPQGKLWLSSSFASIICQIL